MTSPYTVFVHQRMEQAVKLLKCVAQVLGVKRPSGLPVGEIVMLVEKFAITPQHLSHLLLAQCFRRTRRIVWPRVAKTIEAVPYIARKELVGPFSCKDDFDALGASFPRQFH